MPTTRERLVRAAVGLFQQQGYHGTGVAAVLAATDLPKGSLYHHFPGGKEELAVATVEWLGAEVDTYLDRLLTDGADGIAMTLGIADYASRGLRHTQGSLLTVLATEAAPTSPPIAAALRKVVAGWTDRLATGFARNPDGPPASFARPALALIEGATTLARISGHPADVVNLVTAALNGS